MSQSLIAKLGLSALRILISAASGLAISVIIARSLGANAMGDYSFIVWVSGTISALSLAGLPDAISKFVAHHKGLEDDTQASQFARTILMLQFATAFTAMILGGVIWLWLQPRWTTLIVVALATVVPSALQQLLLAFLEGEQRFDLQAAAAFCGALVQLSTVSAAAIFWPTIMGFLIGNLIASFSLFVMTWFVAKRAKDRLGAATPGSNRRNIVRDILDFALPVYALWILNLVVFDKSEFLFLGHYGKPREIAFYGIAFALSARLATVGESLVYVLFPAFVTAHAQAGIEEVGLMFRRTSRLVQIVAFPLCAWALPLMPRIVVWAYGKQFEAIAPVLQVLLLSIVFSVLMSVSASALYALDRQRLILRWMIPVALLNVMLDMFLIPRSMALGAGIANGIAQAVACIGVVSILGRIVPSSYSIKESAKIVAMALVSAAPLFLAAYYFSDCVAALVIAAVSGPVVYALLLKMFHALTVEEEMIIRRAWQDRMLRKAETH